jgi:hypothetical protein
MNELQRAKHSTFSRFSARVQCTSVIQLHCGVHLLGSSIRCGILFVLAPASCSNCFETRVAQNIHSVSQVFAIDLEQPSFILHQLLYLSRVVTLATACEDRWLLRRFLSRLDSPLSATCSHPLSPPCFPPFFFQRWSAFGSPTRFTITTCKRALSFSFSSIHFIISPKPFLLQFRHNSLNRAGGSSLRSRWPYYVRIIICSMVRNHLSNLIASK